MPETPQCRGNGAVRNDRSSSALLPGLTLKVLGLLPQEFEFLHRSLLGRPSRGMQTLFHPLKAPPELTIGFAQGRLGIDRQISSDVHQNEKKIPDLFFHFYLQLLRNRRSPRSRNAPSLRTWPRRGKLFQMLTQFIGFFAQ